MDYSTAEIQFLTGKGGVYLAPSKIGSPKHRTTTAAQMNYKITVSSSHPHENHILANVYQVMLLGGVIYLV